MSSPSSDESTYLSRQPGMVGKSRQTMIDDMLKNNEEIQKSYPSVDFKAAVIEPTVNLAFDLEKHVDEANQRRYNSLMAEMMKNTADADLGESLVLEARKCLDEYPDIRAQFDAIFVNKRPIKAMIMELHDVLTLKQETVRKMSLPTPEAARSGGGPS